MYHRIATETFDPWNLAVTPEAFAGQLEWLARYRTVLRLSEFAELHRRRKLPRSAIALTFDDGYACTAEVAAPMLTAAGLPATVFIAPEQIKRPGPFWWDELQQIVIEHSGTSLTLGDERIDIGERGKRDWHLDKDDHAWTPRQRGFYRLWQRLRTLPTDRLDAAMTDLRSQRTAQSGRPLPRLMTAPEARAIRSEAIEFGSHTLSHASLPGLARTEKEREIGDSRSACEAVTGVRPSTFAYPYGDYDRECEALVCAAGYGCAVTIESRAVRRDSRLSALPRVHLGNWPSREFASVLHAL